MKKMYSTTESPPKGPVFQEGDRVVSVGMSGKGYCRYISAKIYIAKARKSDGVLTWRFEKVLKKLQHIDKIKDWDENGRIHNTTAEEYRKEIDFDKIVKNLADKKKMTFVPWVGRGIMCNSKDVSVNTNTQNAERNT